MKKYSKLIFLFAMSSGMLAGCGSHEHVFDQKIEKPEYLENVTSCDAPASYFYSCTCGEHNDQTFLGATAYGHHYGEPVEEGKGVLLSTCELCGDIKYDYLDELSSPMVFHGDNYDQILRQYIGELTPFDFYWLPVNGASGYLIEINGEVQSIGNPIVSLDLQTLSDEKSSVEYCLYQFDSTLPAGDYTVRFYAYAEGAEKQILSDASSQFVVNIKQPKLPAKPSCYADKSKLYVNNPDCYFYTLDFGNGHVYEAVREDDLSTFVIDLSEIVFEDESALVPGKTYNLSITGHNNVGSGETLFDFYLAYDNQNAAPKIRVNGNNLFINSTTRKVDIYFDNLKGSYVLNTTNNFEQIDFDKIIFEEGALVDGKDYIVNAVSISTGLVDSEKSESLSFKYEELLNAPSILLNSTGLYVTSPTNKVVIITNTGSVLTYLVNANTQTLIDTEFLTLLSGDALVNDQNYVIYAYAVNEIDKVVSKASIPMLITYKETQKEAKINIHWEGETEEEFMLVRDDGKDFINPLIGLKVGDKEYLSKIYTVTSALKIDLIISSLSNFEQHELQENFVSNDNKLTVQVRVFADNNQINNSDFTESKVFSFSGWHSFFETPSVYFDDETQTAHITFEDFGFFNFIQLTQYKLLLNNDDYVGSHYYEEFENPEITFDENTLTYDYAYPINSSLLKGDTTLSVRAINNVSDEMVFDGVTINSKITITNVCLKDRYITWTQTGNVKYYEIQVGSIESGDAYVYSHSVENIEDDPYLMRSGNTFAWDGSEFGSEHTGEYRVTIKASNGVMFASNIHSEIEVVFQGNYSYIMQENGYIRTTSPTTQISFETLDGNPLNFTNYGYLFGDDLRAYKISELSTVKNFVLNEWTIGNNVNVLGSWVNKIEFGVLNTINCELSSGKNILFNSYRNNGFDLTINYDQGTMNYATDCDFNVKDFENMYGQIYSIEVNNRINFSSQVAIIEKPVVLNVSSTRVQTPVLSSSYNSDLHIDTIFGANLDIEFENQNTGEHHNLSVKVAESSAYHEFSPQLFIDNNFDGNKIGTYKIDVRVLGNGDKFISKPATIYFDYVDDSPIAASVECADEDIYDYYGNKIVNKGQSYITVKERENINFLVEDWSYECAMNVAEVVNEDTYQVEKFVYYVINNMSFSGELYIHATSANPTHICSSLPEGRYVEFKKIDVNNGYGSYSSYYYSDPVKFLNSSFAKDYYFSNAILPGILNAYDEYTYKYEPLEAYGDMFTSEHLVANGNTLKTVVTNYIKVLFGYEYGSKYFDLSNCYRGYSDANVSSIYVPEGTNLISYMQKYQNFYSYYEYYYIYNNSRYVIYADENDKILGNANDLAVNLNGADVVKTFHYGVNNYIYLVVEPYDDEYSIKIESNSGSVLLDETYTAYSTYSDEVFVYNPNSGSVTRFAASSLNSNYLVYID